jgi:integrase
VNVYESILRRFGDWLGHADPTVCSVADVRRPHIEAYKQAVAAMKIGDYTSALRPSHFGRRRGQPLSRSHQIRCISCVRTFFEMIEALEYPGRPGRPLLVRGAVGRADHELSRFIPDADWNRFVEAARDLTPEQVEEHRLPPPYERTRAMLAVLLECGLRAGELCRLDTGCAVTARDAATGAVTHWLRVPMGKLHNDRLVPVRPALVETLDAWMRRRGPQPLLRDERTGKMQDFLFTWRGSNPSPETLNALVAKVCRIAGIARTTSHQFRHTLAVQWRKNGMKIETISQMLGHTSLRMTMRYAAVMPETLRREFDRAFAAIDDAHRITAQVRVVLSPEAHLAASTAWRESLWVDLGIGWCGLSAFLPCDNRLACLPCPNYIEKREHLPLFQEQRSHLLKLRILGTEMLPADRNAEIAGAVEALDGRIVAMGGRPGPGPAAPPRDEPAMGGDQRARPEHHVRQHDRLGAHRAPGAPAPGAP